MRLLSSIKCSKHFRLFWTSLFTVPIQSAGHTHFSPIMLLQGLYLLVLDRPGPLYHLLSPPCSPTQHSDSDLGQDLLGGRTKGLHSFSQGVFSGPTLSTLKSSFANTAISMDF